MIGAAQTVRQLVEEGAIERPMDGNHGELHPKTSDFVPSGIPFIMASDLRDGVLDLENCAFITPELAKTLRKGFAKTGDVLLSHKATMGRTAIVGPLLTPYIILTPQVTYYRVLDEGKLNRTFLKYYFDSPPFQGLFRSWGDAGSTRSYLGITAQLDLPVLVPPMETQCAIAEALSALDDKIRLNRRLNHSIEALVSSIFRSWFVEFDPVVAKRDGKTPTGVPAEAVDLFPGHFQESELGPIPQGWRVTSLSELAEINARTLSKKTLPHEIQHIEISDVRRGDVDRITLYRRGAEPSRARRAVQHGDTIVSAVRPERGSYFLCLEPPDGLVVSTGFVVLSPRSRHWALIYCAATGEDALDHYERHAEGGAYPAMRPDSAGAFRVALPGGRSWWTCSAQSSFPFYCKRTPTEKR